MSLSAAGQECSSVISLVLHLRADNEPAACRGIINRGDSPGEIKLKRVPSVRTRNRVKFGVASCKEIGDSRGKSRNEG